MEIKKKLIRFMAKALKMPYSERAYLERKFKLNPPVEEWIEVC